MIKFEKIQKALEQVKQNEINELKKDIKKIDLKTEQRDWTGSRWNGGTIHTKSTLTERERTKTEKEQKQKLYNKELKQIENKFQKHFEKLAELQKIDFFPKDLQIAINWTASRIWGSNPKAELWASGCGYFEGRSVGGCGYDKRSTAAAEVLEMCKELKALAFVWLNSQKLDFIKKVLGRGYVDLRDFLGYGLRIGALYVGFGAGCGMSSVLEELKALGFETVAAHEPARGADFYKLQRNDKNPIIKKALKEIKASGGNYEE